jgi:hypothetical protein
MSNAKMLLAVVVMVVVGRALVMSDVGLPSADAVTSAGSKISSAVGSATGGGSVSTPAIAAHIRRCESGGNYRAQNSHSTASGAYQFINDTWRGVTGLPGSAKDYPPAVQDRAFIKLWAGGRGAHNWDASRHCWGRYWSG